MSATPLGNAYDKTATKHPAERKLVDRFDAQLRTLLPTDATAALDVGCGEGNHMDDIRGASRDAFVTGIDIADAEWLAKFHEPPRRVSTADASALPFAGESFDLVVALEVLEHVPDPRLVLARDRAGVRRLGAVVGSLGTRVARREHGPRPLPEGPR